MFITSRLFIAVLTVEDVPITRHKSAFLTNLPISFICRGISPNQTTPGRARSPHFEHRGNLLWSISGSRVPCSTNSSVPDRASHIGEVVLNNTYWHFSFVHCTSKSLPCISIKFGCSEAATASGFFVAISWLALGLRPSTFWVIRENVELGVI